MDIMRKKKHRENELNELLEASKNVKKDNFANVAFISFDTISEQERFLNKYSQNLFTSLFSTIKNFKFYFCCCFLSRQSKKKWEKEKGESVSLAPEPDDIIFKNLETTQFGRIIRTCITALVSFFIIAFSFIIVILLTLAQEKIDGMSFGAKNFSKYAVSLGMTVAISIVNTIFQTMLQSLTDLEKHMSITDYNLSFSIKLTVFTFVNSAIVPLISNVIMNVNRKINYELLVSNILMMFLVNGFVSPLMWTFNIGFYLKKWQIWSIESKKNPNMQHKMTQRELNELYEYVDIELAYKYSYIGKTLLMTFFYLPLFPLGIVFSMCGLILGFYLEKFNIGNRYKRPEMMNEAICKFYVNFFGVNFFMLALGDFIFLRDKYKVDYWSYSNIIVFFILFIIPYGQYLNFNFIGVNQSQIINKNYNEVYFTFYNDYERMNPFTRKIGTINYLKRLREKDYITEEEFQNQKKQIEKLSFMQIISQAKPSRTNRAKKSLGKKQGLLNNVGIEVQDNKAIRLFSLIKKLYQRPEDDNESYEIKNSNENDYDYENNIYTDNFYQRKNYKIPNIIHLVGTIFGTEDEKDNTTKLIFPETDNEISDSKYSKDKRYKRNLKFFGKFFMKEKERNPAPFIINIDNKNNIIKKDELNNNLNNKNKFNFENFNKINNINTKININSINTNQNLITREEDFSSNRILSEIKSEIGKGGKNLIRFTNSSYENKEITNDEKDNNINNLIKIDNINNNDITNDNNNENNIEINNNINENNNINNINDNNTDDNNNRSKNENNSNDNEINTNINKQPVSLISNISVTINQFFDKFKNENKDPITDSERIKIENNDNEISKDKNNNKNKEEEIENKNENKYKKKYKKRIPLTNEEQNEINDNKSPINNIINIVLKNDNINNKNKNDEEVDGILFNRIINTNLKKKENK